MPKAYIVSIAIPVILIILLIITSNQNVNATDSVNVCNDSLNLTSEKYINHDTVDIDALKLILTYQQHIIVEKSRQLLILQKIILGFIFFFGILFIYYTFKSLKFFRFRSFTVYKKKKSLPGSLACIKMIARYYRQKISLKKYHKNGKNIPARLSDISDIAKTLGFSTLVFKTNLNGIASYDITPLLVYFPNHLSVLYKFSEDCLHLADPYYGRIEINPYYFATSWYIDSKSEEGIALLFIPSSGLKVPRGKRIFHDKISAIKPLNKKYWKDLPCEILE